MKFSENRIKHYFELAKNACYYSDNKRTRVGCVLVYKGQVLSIGWNCENKTSPVQKQYNSLRDYDPNASGDRSTLHAEMMAMLKARWLDIDWRNVSMFVCRIRKDDSIGMSKPCPACRGYAIKLGIRNFYFTTNDGWSFEKVYGG